MTDEEIINALDDCIAALAKVRWELFPEDTLQLHYYLASEACARMSIDMILGRLDGVPLEQRGLIANDQFLQWLCLSTSMPSDIRYAN